ncbi:hypothetical protein D3C80_1779930 [compost metagenome]
MFKTTVKRLTNIGSFTCSVLRRIAEYIIVSIIGTYVNAVICKNIYPSSMILVSVVKRLKQSCGLMNTNKEKRKDRPNPINNPIPRRPEMPFLSCFPQNCAAYTDTPIARPANTTEMMPYILLDIPTEAIATSPSCPTIN